MWVGALWDQEDMWGTIHAYMATEPKDTTNTMNYLVLGPWRHSGVNYEQRQLNAIKLPGDTATEFRTKVLKPFLDEHLKTNGPRPTPRRCSSSAPGRWSGTVSPSGRPPARRDAPPR